MPFTDSEAAAYGLLSMHAMDMYRVGAGVVTPTPAPGLTASGWTIVGYISGADTAMRSGLIVIPAETVYYGFVAMKGTEVCAVVRGTDGFVEWIEDADFPPVAYMPDLAVPPQHAGAQVEQGFWDLYRTLQLVTPTGQTVGGLANAIPALCPAAGTVTVLGHSLGASLATYLTLDLARGSLGARVQACFFASPHSGNAAFVALFDASVSDYHVFNYQLDVVPRVPLAFGYCVLPRNTVIEPGAAEAHIRFDIGCNHHVVCYCAMLDYTATMAAIDPAPAGEAQSIACILGPANPNSVANRIIDELFAGH